MFSVYKIHDHLDKDVHLVHPAFGNHQGQCDEGTVGDSFGAIRTVEDAVVLKEPQEQGRSNSLVAIDKGMVLHNEIQKHRSLLLYAWIEFLAVPCLIDLAYAAME